MAAGSIMEQYLLPRKSRGFVGSRANQVAKYIKFPSKNWNAIIGANGNTTFGFQGSGEFAMLLNMFYILAPPLALLVIKLFIRYNPINIVNTKHK